MKRADVDMNWMRKGIWVNYSPPFLPGGTSGQIFNGRLGGEPFQIGNPKNNRWVVRIEDMDVNYMTQFGRTCHSCAAIEYVEPTDNRGLR